MGREVSLYLKYPGSKIALQRLQHSFLECVVEHKSGSLEELQSFPPNYLKSDYQLKGTASVVDDELMITFTPKNSGLHTVRIFADTRELCKPVAFVVNHNSEIESTPIDKPLKPTSSLFQQVSPSPAPSPFEPQVKPLQPLMRMSQAFGTQAQRNTQSGYGGPMQQFGGGAGDSIMGGNVGLPLYQQQQSQQQQQLQEQVHPAPLEDSGYLRGFTSDPNLSPSARQSRNFQEGPGKMGMMMDQQQPLRFHQTPLAGIGSRPISMASQHDEKGFAGDLLSMTPEKRSINELHKKRLSGEAGVRVHRNLMTMDHSKVVTPETFESINRNIDQMVGSRGMKTRKRCTVCSKKVKMSKLIYLGDHDFCESCYRRQYTMHSAMDHFQVPVIQECVVDVPMNKKGTRFVTARKTIPDINLRGLEPSEVRYAQEEFKKFDMDSSGWIQKAVLFPLLKACFTAHLKDQEIKHLLTNQALRELITSYGIDDREEVHELEFLSLVAFVAREAISIKGLGLRKAKKFSPHDLEMAYAFHSNFGLKAKKSAPSQIRASNTSHNIAGKKQPSPIHQQQDIPHYRIDSSPVRQSTLLRDSHLEEEGPMGQSASGGFVNQMSPQRFFGESLGAGMMSQRPNYSGQQQGMQFVGGPIGQQQQGMQFTGGPTGQQPQGMQFMGGPLGQQQQGTQFIGGPTGQQQQDRDYQRMSMLLASNTSAPNQQLQQQPFSQQSPQHQAFPQQNPQQQPYPQQSPPHQQGVSAFSSLERDQQQVMRGSTMELYPLSSQVPSAGHQDVLNASRVSAFSQPRQGKAAAPPVAASELQDLPEEDQEDTVELPRLPNNPEPIRPTISLQKKNTNSKRIMEDLKLTGDSADSWMMY